MGRLISRLGLIALLSAATAMPAVAVDLKSAYLAALVYDAELLAAKAGLEESEEGVPVARAALLPQLAYTTAEPGGDHHQLFEQAAA